MPTDPPGTTRDSALADRLETALDALGEDHEPRTRLHEAGGGPRYVNRLILEASPYLLQHAHNPVDWHAWGEEAFAEAARRDVPVFLSAGYATCHWCHVMEEECFDDEEVAALLNAEFVAIKIDRESRPDLDQTYIAATQLQQGHAGWPNSVFLRPDGLPFHTGTYFPKSHFMQLLRAVSAAWRERRTEVDEVAGTLADAIRRQQAARMPESAPPGPETFKAASLQLVQMHNETHGGFSEAQQFPQEVFLLFLLDHWRRTGDEAARTVAFRTLDAIASGGIHDHVGGGFHRYAVDVDWRTPHFEKMLYNQALLGRAFVEGFEASFDPVYRRAAERCFAYVLRDMTDPQGAFLAAEDADSTDAGDRAEEGAFYVWPPASVRAALGEEEAGPVVATLGLDREPTVEAGPVAHLPAGKGLDFDGLDPVLERLREAREARARPLRDDKVIAGWNGLMIRALAEGAVVFARADLVEAASRAGEALWSRHWDGKRLARLWVGGRARGAGLLEDYAWAGLGFLALEEATAESKWRKRAEALAEAIAERFSDDNDRLRMAEAEGPLGPVYDSADAATPSGESSALELMARLGVEAGSSDMLIRAAELRAAIAAQLLQVPLLRPEALVASRILDEGRSTLRRLLAQGRIRVQLRPAATGAGWEALLVIAEGWHLNAHEPGPEWLVGATIEGAEVDWPQGTPRRMGFSEAEVSVYDGAVSAPFLPQEATLRLRLQACSERLCLEPVSTRFRLP